MPISTAPAIDTVILNGIYYCGRCAEKTCPTLRGGPCASIPRPATVQMLRDAALAASDAVAVADAGLPDPDEITTDDSSTDGDEDADVCRVDLCEVPLSDGEGWDGYCGSHADLVYAHDEGDHGGNLDTDCPSCI
jgi:hypothetical protein